MTEKDIGQQQADMARAASEAAKKKRPVSGQHTNLTLTETPPPLRTIGQQQAEAGAHTEDKTSPSKN